MTTAGFWISQHLSPDAIIMTPTKIREFNAQIREEQKLTRDIFKSETFLSSLNLKNSLESTVKNLESKKYFTNQNQAASSAFFKPLLLNMNLDQKFEPQYGLIVRFADERILPTDQGLYETPGDVEFDQLQNSGLDLGTPALILLKSQDGKWLYEMNELTEGWVRAEKVAIGDIQTVQDFAQSPEFIVAVAPKVDIFINGPRTHFWDSIRMGSRLPVFLESSYTNVKLPTRDDAGKLVIKDGFVNTIDVHPGYLVYNARTIFNQAFAMFNRPYGWGDRNGEQDCSRFIQEVFATVGIKLPRNSKEQAQVGQSIAFDEKTTDPQKQDALKNLTTSIHVLTLKGHIMLFLGVLDDKAYVIHDVHAYREKTSDGDVARVINRVAVTTLNLGEGSSKGSLLRRLTGIRTMDSTTSKKEETP